MRQAFIATIQVAILADTEGAAADGIADALRDQFLDWSYLKLGGQWLHPTDTLVEEEEHYEEGSAFA